MSGEGDGEDGEEELLADLGVDGGEDEGVSGGVDSSGEGSVDGTMDEQDNKESGDEKIQKLLPGADEKSIFVEIVRRIGAQLLNWVKVKEETNVVNGFWNTTRF